MKRGVDVLGTIMRGHSKMAARMGQASRLPERAGPPSAITAVTQPQRPVNGGSTSGRCLNCGNCDPAQFRTDNKNGDYICLSCGAVDPNRVLSAEEESRTFADDTAADKEKKKRAEKRNDGRLGSYIAVGQEKRGQLANASVQSLQRAHLRTQAPPPEVLQAAEQAGAPAKRRQQSEASIEKALDQHRSRIEHIGAKMDLTEGLVAGAKQLAEQLADQQRKHDRKCADDKCALRRVNRPMDDAVAAALIVRASKMSNDGGGSARAMFEFIPHLPWEVGESKLHKAAQFIGQRLAWDARVGCGAGAAGAAAAAAARAAGADGGASSAAAGESGPLQTAKGLVSRAVGSLIPSSDAHANRLSMTLISHAHGVLEWVHAQSHLLGKDPRTVGSAALVLAYTELYRNDAPGIATLEPITAEVAAKQVQLTTGTVTSALKVLTTERAKQPAALGPPLDGAAVVVAPVGAGSAGTG